MTDTLRRAALTAVTGLGLCLTLLPAGQAQAQAPSATRVPCNDIAALKSAIERANSSGGSIVLARDCVYSLREADNKGDGLPEITGKVRISGDHTTIARSATAVFRIFHVKQGGSLSLDSLTLRGGQAPPGAGSRGGAVYNDRGRLTLTDATVRNNSAGIGGGIWNNRGTLALKATSVRGNTGGTGGGVATSGTMTMRGGALRENTGQIRGGGLANAGDTKLNHVSVDDNDAGDLGGGIVTLAIDDQTGPLRMNFTRIRGNIAQTDGGGILTGADEPTTLYRSTVSRNTANGGPARAGGIENSGQIIRIFLPPETAKQEKSGRVGAAQTPHVVRLIRSAVFKNTPTNCAPPGSVPRCDAAGSATGTNAPKPGRS